MSTHQRAMHSHNQTEEDTTNRNQNGRERGEIHVNGGRSGPGRPASILKGDEPVMNPIAMPTIEPTLQMLDLLARTEGEWQST
jgi:hypothetical protein